MLPNLEFLWLTYAGALIAFGPGGEAMVGLPVSAFRRSSGDIASWSNIRDKKTGTHLLDPNGSSTLYTEHLTKTPASADQEAKAIKAFVEHLHKMKEMQKQKRENRRW